jgi:hypothetical protein
MRKLSMLVLIILLLPAVVVAHAQSGGALTRGQWTNGTLTATDCVHRYTFQATAGEILVAEAMINPNTYGLDPALVVVDSSGAVLASNDDLVAFNAGLVLQIPADGEYTAAVLASSLYTSQSDNTANFNTWTLTCDPDASYGDYQLRVDAARVIQAGDSVEATVYADSAKDLPNLYVLAPAQSVTWAIGFDQPEGELWAQIELVRVSDKWWLFDLNETSGTRSGTLNVDLDAETVYLLIVHQSFQSLVFDDISIPVTITVSEVKAGRSGSISK